MTAEIKVTIDNARVTEALAKAPGVIERHAEIGLQRGAEETAREMKAVLTTNRSAARSTLIQSIRAVRLEKLHYFVGPAVNYARMVEEGTGPAAGRRAYMPNPTFLRDYVKQRSGINFKGKPGSTRRRQAMDEIRDRAFALAVHIRRHGTKPHPFVAPTREKMQPRIRELVEPSVARGLREVFGA